MGLLEVELLSVLGVTGIAVLSAVSFTESLPFPGGAALAINVVLKQSGVRMVCVKYLFRSRLLALSGVLTAFHAFNL